ncbi:competence type IV pilus minor pilin ComGG [Terrilactibacillus laevilacticus]|uniref:competence type IV pilus minor pilin ComGG n=1 Tax=Terrilactibacillus laevilacticus TaxID=1380157 RepID=UPI0011469B30|nr:competence type IV pilus minor pilin ComGG [Terrilactibacillus laevilacticus]
MWIKPIRTKMNEDGFVLPLCVIISFLIIAFALHAVILLQNEQEFKKESDLSLRFNEVTQLGLFDIKKNLAKNELPTSGSFIYDDGIVNFQMTKSTDKELEVFVTVSIDGHEQKNKFYYDTEKGGITKWIDGI